MFCQIVAFFPCDEEDIEGIFRIKILPKSFRPTKFYYMYIILLMWKVNKNPIILTWEIFSKYTVCSSEQTWVSNLQPENVVVIK